MLFDIIDTLKNKLKESEDFLKKLSSDNLKSMFSIHSDISNKPDLIVDDLSASTSQASNSELDSIVIKPMIRDVNEVKLPMSLLGLGSCATRLLNELLVDTKLYSIIKRYIPV
jgi:hypothetical protein